LYGKELEEIKEDKQEMVWQRITPNNNPEKAINGADSD